MWSSDVAKLNGAAVKSEVNRKPISIRVVDAQLERRMTFNTTNKYICVCVCVFNPYVYIIIIIIMINNNRALLHSAIPNPPTGKKKKTHY